MIGLSIIFPLCLGALAAPASEGPQKVGLYMPEVQPKTPDTYLCHGMKMNKSETYITGFLPTADMNIAHHMLLYGCTEPGSDEATWNCGEMASKDTNFKAAPTCASGSNILYAWAMDAPSLSLPEGVAFEVGGRTDIKYLVLQVHYKNVDSFLPPKNGNDSSGLTLITQKTKLPRRAGVYLLGTGGSIAPKSTVYMETACMFKDDVVIHPFAFRTHAHSLGKVVSGYRIRDGEWKEIGRMSPQKPQMFYNATNPNMEVQRGDILAARCTMKNDKSHVVNIGSTQNDEMCNFYVMYYVDGTRIMNEPYCFTSGPPNWSWEDFQGPLNPQAAPESASTIPGAEEPLEQTTSETSGKDEQDYIDTLLDNIDSRDLDSLLEELAEEGDNSYYNPYDN